MQTEQRPNIYGEPGEALRRVIEAVSEMPLETSDPIPERFKGSGVVYYRAVADREITVIHLIMGTVRVTIGDRDGLVWDDGWCYADPAAGILAACAWDGEGDPPTGWFRNISTARRRTGGDPDQEYVAR